jgi:3-oxoacyl-[acyl-carrier-protein] synthase-3
MKRSRIVGTGRALPPKVMTNADIEKIVDTTDAWINERTGIRERRVLDPSLTNSDLSTEAARNALDAAGLTAKDVDCIVLGTVTPDMPMPSTAVFVQQKLGCRPTIPAFDLSAACAGFVYGMSIADSFIRAGQFERVLVIGVEILTRIVDWNDRNTCVLFGDGAGAVVMVGEDQPQGARVRGVLTTHIYADGAGAKDLWIPGGGSTRPTSAETVAENLHKVKMNGKAVFQNAVRNISQGCLNALEACRLTPADIDLVVAHQANLRIVEAVAQRVGLPMEKFHLNIHKYGNTSSASIPIALDEAVRDGKVKEGMHLLMGALGAGFAWGSAIVRW